MLIIMEKLREKFDYHMQKSRENVEAFKEVFTYNKDKYKDLNQVVRGLNYPFEKHYYNTEDDYINCVFRINGPKGTTSKENNLNKQPKPVLLYQHGLLDSSAGVCCDGIDSLAFFFADAGFDVWLNNSRGNCFSRDHKYLDPDNDEAYWDFSFHELGKYDQPALISYILKHTDMKSLTYFGHSQGTTQMFAALSMDPEFFRGKINLCVMIAPVATVHNATSKILQDHANNEKLVALIQKMGPEVLPSPQIDGKISATFMKVLGNGKGFLSLLSDSDPRLVSKKGLETYMGHFPAGASFKQINHFRQLVLAKRF
jgi:lysosomal acid lipase/cholesteryl ester hydrolase